MKWSIASPFLSRRGHVSEKHLIGKRSASGASLRKRGLEHAASLVK